MLQPAWSMVCVFASDMVSDNAELVATNVMIQFYICACFPVLGCRFSVAPVSATPETDGLGKE